MVSKEAILLVIVAVSVLSGTGKAETPACFPERTVLWAAKLSDKAGNVIGGVRAGHTVRVVDDFVGSSGSQALVEVDEPMPVQGYVDRRMLLAFTREETELLGGFCRWAAGAPLVVGRAEESGVRVFLADPHNQPEQMPSILAPCSAIRGVPVGLANRDRCHGAWPETEIVTHGDSAVFWKSKQTLRARGGDAAIEIPAEQWLFFVKREGRHAIVEYRKWWQNVLYTGRIPAKGMRHVPAGEGRGVAHLCCEGFLNPEPGENVRTSREATMISSAPVRTETDATPIATLGTGATVRVLRELPETALILYRWPTWDEKNYTFQLRGWVDNRAVSRPAAQSSPVDAGQAVQQGSTPYIRRALAPAGR